MSAPQWTVVDVGTEQSGEMRALFQRVFGHSLSEGLWCWKYDGGRGVAVGARSPVGELLAHYGGTLRRVFFLGHPALAVQIGDVMVASEGRAMLSHKGPFGMVAQAFLTRNVGSERGPVLGFGFPNARHMRLGEKLAHYAQVDKMFELSWLVQGSGRGLLSLLRSGIRVNPIDWADSSTTARLDKLWSQMQLDLHGFVLPMRDSSWWRHRYANHPEHRYLCFWVRSRWSRRTLGAVVLRVQTTADANGDNTVRWELMDWLAPLSQTTAMQRAAMGVVCSEGGTALMGWFSSSVKEQFTDSGAVVEEVCAVGVTVPEGQVFSIEKGFAPSVAALQGKWWLTGGDTDFR